MRAYRTALAAVMQDDVLLVGSLKDNICFNAKHPNQRRIEQCAQLAAVDADIKRMRMATRR